MLITGAGGFIGMNLMKQTDAVPMDLKYGDNVCHVESWEALFRSGPIIHLAAESGVPQSIQNPDLTFTNNVVGTYMALQAAREYKTRIVLASSSAKGSPYGASKACGEVYADAFHKSYGVSYAALRFSNVYGPLSDKKTSCIPQMIKGAVYNNEIIVHGDGSQKRDFVYVDDVCFQILEAAGDDWVGVRSIGTGILTKIIDVAEIIAELTGANIVFQETRESVPDPSPIYTDSHTVPLEEGIKRTLEYFT